MNTQTQNTAPSVEELLYWWPSIARRANNVRAKGFALSIQRASRRRNWQPTHIQRSIIRSMVRDMFTPGAADDDEAILIE